MLNDDEPLLTISDIAQALDVTRAAAGQWTTDPEFPPSRGSVIRSGRQRAGYRLNEVIAWCEPRGLPNRDLQARARGGSDPDN